MTRTRECDCCNGIGTVMKFISDYEGEYEAPCRMCRGESIIWIKEKTDELESTPTTKK